MKEDQGRTAATKVHVLRDLRVLSTSKGISRTRMATTENNSLYSKSQLDRA